MRLSSRPPLARLALIDREIRKGTWPTSGRLAGMLDVGRRTVLRDLDFLRDRLHAPLAARPPAQRLLRPGLQGAAAQQGGG
jgi:hypothetical protein